MNEYPAGEPVDAIGVTRPDVESDQLAGDAEALATAASSIQETVSDTANDIASTVSALIRAKPLFAVGLAAAVAYVVGRLRA